MAYSGRSGRDITNFCTLNRLWLGQYVVSYTLIEGADNTLSNGPQEFTLIGRAPAMTVYTYSEVTVNGETTLQFVKKYSSLRECVADLDQNRNKNTKTLQLRIKHNALYHNLRVSHTPLIK